MLFLSIKCYFILYFISNCSFGLVCCFIRAFFVLAAMIHWTRQIKELLNNQDAHETSENAGPLEEIAFWSGRCNDLLGISDQLVKPGVKQIVSILTLAKSSYVGPFLKLSKLIQV